MFDLQEGVQQLVLGLYIIRGDNMYASFLWSSGPKFSLSLLFFLSFLPLGTGCSVYFRSVVGELDEELDSSLDLSKLRAHPLKPVIH